MLKFKKRQDLFADLDNAPICYDSQFLRVIFYPTNNWDHYWSFKIQRGKSAYSNACFVGTELETEPFIERIGIRGLNLAKITAISLMATLEKHILKNITNVGK